MQSLSRPYFVLRIVFISLTIFEILFSVYYIAFEGEATYYIIHGKSISLVTHIFYAELSFKLIFCIDLLIILIKSNAIISKKILHIILTIGFIVANLVLIYRLLYLLNEYGFMKTSYWILMVECVVIITMCGFILFLIIKLNNEYKNSLADQPNQIEGLTVQNQGMNNQALSPQLCQQPGYQPPYSSYPPPEAQIKPIKEKS